MTSLTNLGQLLLLFARHHVIERLKAPLMPLLLAGTWLLASGTVGALGTQHLFWHYSFSNYCYSCLALGAFVATWCFVSVLLDSDQPWLLKRLGTRTGEPERVVITFRRFTMYVLLSSVLIDGILATAHWYYVAFDWLPTGSGSFLGSWALMGAGSLALLCGTAVAYRITGRDAAPTWLAWLDARRPISLNESELAPWWLHRVALCSALIFTTALLIVCGLAVAGHPIVHPQDRAFSPAVSYSLLATIIVLVYGAILYFRNLGLVWSTVVAVAAVSVLVFLFEKWEGRSPPIRGLETSLPKEYDAAVRASIGGSSESDDLLKEHDAPVMVVVAVSGGGIRAQVWATTVLCMLEKNLSGSGPAQPISFPNALRMVTGTSGGMVGATYYVATLDGARSTQTTDEQHANIANRDTNRARSHQSEGKELTPEEMIFRMSRDALTPTVKALLFHEPLRYLLPGTKSYPPDRGRVLEDAWAYWTGGSSARKAKRWNDPTIDSPFNWTLGELRKAESTGQIPFLVYAPTIAEDGRRLLISNWKLDELVALPRLAASDSALSISAIQASRVWKDETENLQLKTLARLNANFPYAVTSPRLPTDPALHVMDAGFYDNYGMDIAGRWLYANRKQLERMRDQKILRGVLLVQISASTLNRNPASAAWPDTDPSPSPEVAGFSATSFQKAIFMSDHYVSSLDSYFNGKRGQDNTEEADFFKFATFEFDASVSLSWYLTPSETYALMHPFIENETTAKEEKDELEFIDPARMGDYRSEFDVARELYNRRKARAKQAVTQQYWIGRRKKWADDTNRLFDRHEQTGVRCRKELRDVKNWWNKKNVATE